MLPVNVFTLEAMRKELGDGSKFVSQAKLQEAKDAFAAVLRSLLLVALSSDAEAKQVNMILFLVRTQTHMYAVERHNHERARVLGRCVD